MKEVYDAMLAIEAGEPATKELINIILSYYWDEMLGHEQLKQIEKGIKSGINYSWYADRRYNWKQMREIRLGLEAGINIFQYLKPMYNWTYMKEIRLELEREKKNSEKMENKTG